MRALLAVLVLLVSQAAGAQEWPARPVTIMVPYTAGGPSDVTARILAEALQARWNQRVLIDNRAGGGTVIGTAAAARATPDGYYFAFAGGSFVVNAALRSDLPYDSLRDFRGVSVFADAPLDVVASRAFPANSLAELIALGRDRPLSYATAGPGSVANMSGELLARETGMRLEHVPYPGDAAAFSDVVSGRVDFRIGSWSDDSQHVRSGALKLLAMFYPRRINEAPTVAEVVPAMARYPAGVFNALVTQAAVPDAVVARVSETLRQVAESAEVQRKFAEIGLYPRHGTPAETDAFLREQVEVWGTIARQAGISLR